MKDDYTSRRTSKVTYRSEVALPNPLEKWSRRVETAAKLGEISFGINRWRLILHICTINYYRWNLMRLFDFKNGKTI